jgi:hypothetical protein
MITAPSLQMRASRLVPFEKHRLPHGGGSAPLPNRERKRPVVAIF